MLVFLSGPQALAEDEPAAKAPLPPLVRGAPPETGERQMPELGPSRRNQLDPSKPAIRSDRAKSHLSQKKPRLHSASHRGASVAKKGEAPARLADHSKAAASRRPGHRTVASGKRRDRSPAEAAIGSLSPLSDYPNRRIGSSTEPPAEPRE